MRRLPTFKGPVSGDSIAAGAVPPPDLEKRAISRKASCMKFFCAPSTPHAPAVNLKEEMIEHIDTAVHAMEERMEANNKALEERIIHEITNATLAHGAPAPELARGKCSWNSLRESASCSLSGPSSHCTWSSCATPPHEDGARSRWAVAEQDPELVAMLRELRTAGARPGATMFHHLHHHHHHAGGGESDLHHAARSTFRSRTVRRRNASLTRERIHRLVGPVLHPDGPFRSVVRSGDSIPRSRRRHALSPSSPCSAFHDSAHRVETRAPTSMGLDDCSPSSHPLPSHPILFRSLTLPIPSHPVPSHPVPSQYLLPHPNPTPTHPLPIQLIST